MSTETIIEPGVKDETEVGDGGSGCIGDGGSVFIEGWGGLKCAA